MFPKTKNQTEMINYYWEILLMTQSNMAAMILEKQQRISILQSVHFTQSSSSLQMSSTSSSWSSSVSTSSLIVSSVSFDRLIDWLIVYGFTSLSRIFHLYGDVTIAGEGLQNLGLCSALRVFEHGWIFIVPHLLWRGISVFPVSSEGPPHLVAFYDTRGDVEDL
jgi:hypothetical protein